jgi:hypothetical protein
MPTSQFPDSGTGAPANATFLVQTADADLPDAQALSVLSSGIMRVETSTGQVTALTTSAGIAANLSDETGTGALVFANTPTLVTPVIGAATGTSVNLSGDARAATFHVGATAGVDATVVIPTVGTLTFVKGIITDFS